MSLEIHEVTGGYVLRDPKLGKDHWGHVGLAIQRDASKVHGGGIDAETARKRALLWAHAEELLQELASVAHTLAYVEGDSHPSVVRARALLRRVAG